MKFTETSPGKMSLSAVEGLNLTGNEWNYPQRVIFQRRPLVTWVKQSKSLFFPLVEKLNLKSPITVDEGHGSSEWYKGFKVYGVKQTAPQDHHFSAFQLKSSESCQSFLSRNSNSPVTQRPPESHGSFGQIIKLKPFDVIQRRAPPRPCGFVRTTNPSCGFAPPLLLLRSQLFFKAQLRFHAIRQWFSHSCGFW